MENLNPISSGNNPWEQYKQDHPWKPADTSDSGVDPFEAIAAGALPLLIGKGIGAAIQAAFADGGVVRKPKNERQARENRERRDRAQAAKANLQFAGGGNVQRPRNEREAKEMRQASEDALPGKALAIYAVLQQVKKYLSPEQAADPQAAATVCESLLATSDDAEQQEWVDELLQTMNADGNPEAATEINAILHALRTGSFPLQMQQEEPNYASQTNYPDSDKPGVHMAFGGNVGIALGAAADEYDRQKYIRMAQDRNDLQLKLAQPQLNTLDEQTENYRTSLGADTAKKQAAIGLIPQQTENTRLELTNKNADQQSSAYGHLGQYLTDGDSEGATRYANSLNLPQFGGAKVSSLTHDPATGATATLDNGQSVLIPQASIDRGTKAMNGGFKFFQDKNTGDVVRTNEKTGEAGIANAGTGAGSRLTMAQMRTNEQIQGAREIIGGMTPEEIRLRTTKATDTGRENPDYDPTLASQLRIANQPKFGSDPQYERHVASKSASQPAQPQQNPYAAKFNADPRMKGNTLGTKTQRGYQVLDASGNVVGYYD